MPKKRIGGKVVYVPKRQIVSPPQNQQAQAAPPPVQQAPPQPTPVPPANSGPRNYQAMDDNGAQQMRNNNISSYNGTVDGAVKMYISNTNFDGNGHSLSQTMNFLNENGFDLSNTSVNAINSFYRSIGSSSRIDASKLSSMEYTNRVMQSAVHPLGQDTILTRMAHGGIIKDAFGISNWNNMSQAQLQSALVGGTFTNKTFMSTSYDAKQSPFLNPSGGITGGREVVFNIKAGANTNVLLGAKAQTEVVIAKGTPFKVTGVRFSGQTATPRLGSPTKQIVIDIETL